MTSLPRQLFTRRITQTTPDMQNAIERQEDRLRLPHTNKPRLVVIGGGFAGLNLIKNIDISQYQVVLLDRYNYHTFVPLLYQVATAGLEAGSVIGPLRKVFQRNAEVHFRMLEARRIDPQAQRIHTSLGEIAYDHLVIAAGTKPNYFGNQDIARHALPLKTLPDAVDMRNRVLQALEQAEMSDNSDERDRLLHFVVVGGGPTGVELAGALAELKRFILPADYPDTDIERMTITLVEGTDRLLSTMSAQSSRHALHTLEEMGVEVRLNKMVKSYDGKRVIFQDGDHINSETLIWGAGVTGAVVGGLDPASVQRGQYVVDTYNRIKGYDNIYALGDIARFVSEAFPQGLPGVAQVAIQQGKHLAKNLNRMARGRELRPFAYFDKGSLATIGRNKAVADLPNGWHLSGFPAWFIWAFIHIYYLVGMRNKVVTFVNWIINYLTYERGVRMILRPEPYEAPAEAETRVPAEVR